MRCICEGAHAELVRCTGFAVKKQYSLSAHLECRCYVMDKDIAVVGPTETLVECEHCCDKILDDGYRRKRQQFTRIL